MKKILLSFVALALVAGSFIGCKDRSDLTAPAAVNTGSANFTRYVALGNSLTAGYQSSSLYQSGQKYAWTAQLAKQVGTAFEIPWVSDPGIGGRIDVQSLNLSVVPPQIVLKYNPANGGAPTNTALARPYNNLGVPGAILYDMLDTSDFAAKALAPRSNPYFSVVMRSAALGKSLYDQAKAQNPTFMTVWIGNNDVLGYATSGGTKGTDATGKLPSDTTVFKVLYNQLITKITTELPNTKLAVANIPTVTAIPFFTTVGQLVAASLAPITPAVSLYYQKTNEAGVATGTATVAQLATFQVLLTLPGSTYAPYIGQPTGVFYRMNGFPALPSGIDTTKPFGLHPQNPWPNALILDPAEITNCNNAQKSFNATILAAASASANIAHVDVAKVFSTIRANDATGTIYDGVNFKTSFVSGGLFSLDGVHPTNQGAAIIANEFIKAINAKFAAAIPMINVASVPSGLNFAKPVQTTIPFRPTFPKGTFDNLFF